MTTTATHMDDDQQAFYRYAQGSKVCLAIWEKIALGHSLDNETSLALEMEETALQLDEFVSRLEANLKTRNFRTSCLGSEEYAKCKEICKEFDESLAVGVEIMGKLLQALGVKGHETAAAQLQAIRQEVEREEREEGVTDAKGKIRRMSEGMLGLLVRFSKVLQQARVQQESPPVHQSQGGSRTVVRGARTVSMGRESLASSLATLHKEKKKPSTPIIKFARSPSPPSRRSNPSSRGNTGMILTAAKFLEDYAVGELLPLEYVQVLSTRTALFREYVFSCKLHTIVGEGRGRSRQNAKQAAASEVLKILIARQRKGTLTEEFRPLTGQQVEQAMSLMCEAVDYEDELQRVCSKGKVRPAIFTSMVNTSLFAVKCKAAGVSAIGRGKTKEVARRMAAKIVLDRIAEVKRMAKEANLSRNHY